MPPGPRTRAARKSGEESEVIAVEPMNSMPPPAGKKLLRHSDSDSDVAEKRYKPDSPIARRAAAAALKAASAKAAAEKAALEAKRTAAAAAAEFGVEEKT